MEIIKSQEEIKYNEALKRVKKIKSFYTHAGVYVVVNAMLLILKYQKLEPGESFFQFENFSTILFWGIGLVAHGLSVFLPTWFLGNDWEERKIKELMDKEKGDKWE